MRTGGAISVLVACCVILVSSTAPAAAQAPAKLTRFPEDGLVGAEAGRLDFPLGIGTNNANGHVYVAEGGNRISEFTAWGEFVKAWGWGVRDGSPEPQVCGEGESPPHCQEGLEGSAAAQMRGPNGIAIAADGSIYVLERPNRRVQKFSPAGKFELMFGGDVDKTNNANVCTAASGHECGIGVDGSGNGEFSWASAEISNYIAVANDGTVYVGDTNRIQEFNSDGTFKGALSLTNVGAGGLPRSLAVDPVSGDIYLSYSKEPVFNPPIYRIDADTGSVVDEIPVAVPPKAQLLSLATDKDGNLFVIVDPIEAAKPEAEPRVMEYGPSGEVIIDYPEAFAAPPTALQQGKATSLRGVATNTAGDVYVLEGNFLVNPLIGAVNVYGPPPIEYGPPPAKPPSITDQFAISAGSTTATLKAKINPGFWADTAYYLEYGTAPCFEGGCAVAPTPPGHTLTDQIVNVPLATEGINLSDLALGTTYHYRFVVQSGGGGPVFGLAGKSGAEAEGTFTTLPAAVSQPPCPANQAFRSGSSALLPDCRAYEMVSPVDKNGADIETVFNSLGFPTALDQAATDGEALTYSAYRAFGEVESSPYSSQYIASRAPSGWSSRGISPPREGPSLYTTAQLDFQYKAFTADLCHGWLVQDTDHPLAAEGWVEGSPTVYRRELCPGNGPYTTVAPLRMPTVAQIFEFIPELQGFSADGSVALIQANGKLTNNGQTARQLYEATSGGLRLVCILPGGTASKGACSAGAGGSVQRLDRVGNLGHAISEDGTRIYWSESAGGPGKLYLRINHAETKVVSEVTDTHFWGAAADGSVAVYSAGNELRRYSLADEASVKVAGGFGGIAAISEDAGRVYFTSSEAIAGAVANPEGEEASAGQANLYLYEEGEPATVRFVARLSGVDTGGNTFPNDTASFPVFHVAQTTPDGGALAFVSTRSLTGYDNTDAASGNPASEVYVYRLGSGAGTEALTCVSCMPSGVRPQARVVKTGFLAAAQLPVAESQLVSPRVLSEDGARLFFESFDPLNPRDGNRQQDVYEWEATAVGNCAVTSPGYNPAFEGCVNLISSGQSTSASQIVDSSPDGRDVFFKTDSSLLPQDPGLVDIYDAREGGGFPPAPPAPVGCQGEGCQPAGQVPTDAAPSSETYEGPGNEAPSKPAHKCPKGKHKAKRHGKRVCVKNKPKHHSARKGARR